MKRVDSFLIENLLVQLLRSTSGDSLVLVEELRDGSVAVVDDFHINQRSVASNGFLQFFLIRNPALGQIDKRNAIQVAEE